MYTYDEVLASGFCVFKDELSTLVVIAALEKLNKEEGIRFKRDELRLKKIQKFVDFNNCIYTLKDGYTLKDVEKYIRIALVSLFQEIQLERDSYYKNLCSGKTYVKKNK